MGIANAWICYEKGVKCRVRLNHSFVEPLIRNLRQRGPLGLKPILWMEISIRWVIMHCISRSWLKPQPYQWLMVFIEVLPWLGSSCCRILVTTLPRNYGVSSREKVSIQTWLYQLFSFQRIRIGIFILPKIRRLHRPYARFPTSFPRLLSAEEKEKSPRNEVGTLLTSPWLKGKTMVLISGISLEKVHR